MSGLIHAAYNQLGSGEHILAQLKGYDVNNPDKEALLLATDRRVLMVTKVGFLRDNTRSFYGRIDAVDKARGFWHSKIKLHIGTQVVTLKDAKGDIDKFVEARNRS